LTTFDKMTKSRGMSAIEAFDECAEEYDRWYCKEPGASIYESEVKAVKALVPRGLGVEVGVGTGVFASKLKTSVGVDPALRAIMIAKKRGVSVIQGVAESLPFKDECFGYVSSILTLDYLKDPESSFREAWRVLKYGGSIILCFVPRNSSWGILYSKKKAEGHKMYRHANFYDLAQVEEMLNRTGFGIEEYSATLSQGPESIVDVEEPCSEVRNHGFVCIRGVKT